VLLAQPGLWPVRRQGHNGSADPPRSALML
jgi:hypothetical protein